MQYTIYQNKQKNSTAYMKYYARAQYAGTIGTDKLAERIQRNCSMKHSDVIAVLKELQEVMVDYMQEGYKVKLDGIGTLKISLKSEGVNLPSDFKPAEHIKSMKVNFMQTWSQSAGGPRVKMFTDGVTLTRAK